MRSITDTLNDSAARTASPEADTEGIRKTRSGRHKVYWRLDDYSQGSETFDTSEEAKRYRDQLRVDLREGTWIDPRRGKALFADWVNCPGFDGGLGGWGYATSLGCAC